MQSTSSKAPAPASGAATTTTPEELPVGAAEAYAKYLPIARQIPEEEVSSYRSDPRLAYQNIKTATTALLPHESQLATLPSPFSLPALKELPLVALATIYAAARVDLSSKGTIHDLEARASKARELLLLTAVSLSAAGLLDKTEVTRLGKSKGHVERAHSCVELAELFRKNSASLAGKHPLTQADIDEARTLGNELLTVLKPKNAPTLPRSKQHTEVADRDALGTMLIQHYDQHARRAGMWLWVEDVDDHVPPLHSHAGHRRKTDTATPAAAPTILVEKGAALETEADAG